MVCTGYVPKMLPKLFFVQALSLLKNVTSLLSNQYNTPLSLLAKKIWLVKRQIKRKEKGLLTRRHRASPQTQSGPAAGLRYVEEQTSAGYVRVLHHLESKNPTSSLADICSAGRGSRAHVANYSHRVPRCGQASRTIGCRADRTAAEVRASPAVRS